MGNRFINIKQFCHMSLEAVYYDDFRNTLITLTKDTGLGEKGKKYHVLARVAETTHNFKGSKIFNIHLSDDKDIKECEDKFIKATFICLYSKPNNNFHIADNKYEFDSSHSNEPPEYSLEINQKYTFPEVELTPRATASIGSVNEGPSGGYNYYKADVDNGLINTFLNEGVIPLPLHKQTSKNVVKPLPLEKQKTPEKTNNLSTKSKYALGIGAAIVAFGVFAVKSGLAESVAKIFNPRPS